MSNAYTSSGKRRSSMTHATRGRKCDLCGRTVFGNGGWVAHGRGHVRKGEAIELVKHYGDGAVGRAFLAPDDTERIEKFQGLGFVRPT